MIDTCTWHDALDLDSDPYSARLDVYFRIAERDGTLDIYTGYRPQPKPDAPTRSRRPRVQPED